MAQQQFQSLRNKRFKRTPVMREILADLETPLSVYLKLAHGPYSYLFESVQGGEKWGRYSMIGLPSRTAFRIHGHQISMVEDQRVVETITVEDPLTWIETLQASFEVSEVVGLPRFTGGLVGYFGYDTIRYIEPRLKACPNPDPLNNPDILLALSEEVVVFDNLSGKMYIIVHADLDQPGALDLAERRLDQLVGKMGEAVPSHSPERLATVEEGDFVSGFTEQRFMDAVEVCKQYIAEGDVMQVVLSQRLSVPFKARPLDLYRALRSLNPSPYMYFMDLGDFHIVGSSPEILVRLEEGEVTVRPIAGTRPRGATEEEDQAWERELLADPKELAEHLMLIDLGRNDAGRIAETGSVKLTEKMKIERYSHVMHIVSNVTGILKKDTSPMDVLRATFPAGTVSGAPKIRAMQIIDELEPVKRGVYAGAVGYLSWSGNMDTAIAIRTAVIKDQQLHIQVGAGVVYDSIAKYEWKETMNKGRAVFKAVEMATAGLDGHRKGSAD